MMEGGWGGETWEGTTEQCIQGQGDFSGGNICCVVGDLVRSHRCSPPGSSSPPPPLQDVRRGQAHGSNITVVQWSQMTAHRNDIGEREGGEEVHRLMNIHTGVHTAITAGWGTPAAAC